MKIHRTKPLFGLAFALLAATACAANEDEPTVAESDQALDEAADDASPAADDASPAADRDHHTKRGRHGHHRKGPDKILWTALEELELSDAQRTTIEGTARALHERPAPSPEMETRRKALADAVRSGRVDAQAFTGAVDDAPMKAMHAKLVAAIDELHATLTPEQRVELVGILEQRHEARAAKWAAKKAEKDARGEDGHRAEKGSHPARRLLHGLDVSDEQRAEIASALSDAGLAEPPSRDGMKAARAEMKERRAAMLEAFSRADFDASRDLPPPPDGMASHHEHFVKSLAVVVPLLDESQRAELADRLEQGPKHFRKGGKRRGMR